MSEGWEIRDLILDTRYDDVVRSVLFTFTSCVDFKENVRGNSETTHLMYDTVNDSRSCSLCAALDGLIVPVSDPFWSYYNPPNHWGCRCGTIPLWGSSIGRTLAGNPKNRILTYEMAQCLPALDPQWAFSPGDIPKTRLAEFLKTRLTLFVQYPDLAERSCRDALRELRDFRA